MTVPDFIGIYPKCFSNEYCEKAIKMFDEAEELGFTTKRKEQNYRAGQVEDTSIFHGSFDMNHAAKAIYQEFNMIIWEAYHSYAEQYKIALTENTADHNIYEAKIQKTRPGEGFHIWHYESGDRPSSQRILVFTVYLNDIEEGGETEFLYYHKRVKPETGTVTIFPAGFTHLHRGNPPLSETKYIMTGWFEM